LRGRTRRNDAGNFNWSCCANWSACLLMLFTYYIVSIGCCFSFKNVLQDSIAYDTKPSLARRCTPTSNQYNHAKPTLHTHGCYNRMTHMELKSFFFFKLKKQRARGRYIYYYQFFF
jgi:hypothetical protein